MAFWSLSLLPVFLCGFSALSFVVIYIVSVSLEHVEAFFPYISMTGTTRPESAVFGQCLTISAVLAWCCIYIRYSLVSHITSRAHSRINKCNFISLVLGAFICIGLTIVGNFQATTSLPVHLIGAFLVFIGGWVYTLLQTIITYLMSPVYNGVKIARIRLIISFLLLFSLLITFIAGSIAQNKWASKHTDKDRMYWNEDDPGYAEHVTSAFGEWAMALLQMVFFLTYTSEFNKISLGVQIHMVVSHLDEEPVSDSITLTQ